MEEENKFPWDGIAGSLILVWCGVSALRVSQWAFGFELFSPDDLGDWQNWTGWPAFIFAIYDGAGGRNYDGAGADGGGE
jgi:hypothetical protein